MLFFYFLYIVLDCAFKIHLLLNLNLSQVLSLPKYYFLILLKRLDLLLPLSLCLVIPQTYHHLNSQGQLFLLRSNGYSEYMLLKPALYTCLVSAFMLIMHTALITPSVTTSITNFEHTAFQKKPSIKQRILYVKNGILFYSGELPNVHDVYWLKKDKIYHIKQLNIEANRSLAQSTTTFSTTSSQLEKINHQKQHAIDSLTINDLIPLNLLKPHDQLSFHQLHKLRTNYLERVASEISEINTLYWKTLFYPLGLALLPLWGILSVDRKRLKSATAAFLLILFILLYGMATPLCAKNLLDPLFTFSAISSISALACLFQLPFQLKHIFRHRPRRL